MKLKKIDIKEIEGFRLGNAENAEAGTGVTVVIAERGAVAGVDVRGGGPATRETDLLRSENTVDKINAVVLSGGSAFGLEAASGVMRALAERGQGFRVGNVTVPIVTGASLFDLAVGKSDVFPDVQMGKDAVRNAFTEEFEAGNHGAGTGASVGKMLGMDRAMKTGIGTFACGDGLIEVGAISAVNACADIYNGAGNIIAGLRNAAGTEIQGTVKVLKGMIHPESEPDLDITDIRRMAQEEAKAGSPDKDAAASEPVSEKDSIARALMASYEMEQAQLLEKKEEAFADTPEDPADKFSYEVPAGEPEPEPEPEEAEILAEDHPDITVSSEEPVVHSEDEEPVVHAEDQYLEMEQTEPEESAPQPETPAPIGYSETPIVTEIPEAADISAEEETAGNETELPYEEEAASYEELQAVQAEAPADVPVYEPETVPAEEPVYETSEDVSEEPYEEEAAEPEPVSDEYELSQEDKDDMGYDIAFNTTISCVITNAIITKSQANKLASILHDAYARAIKPVHTTLDGDTVFVMSTCTQEVNFDAFAALATDVLQYAIIDGAHSAESAYGLPAARDIIRK